MVTCSLDTVVLFRRKLYCTTEYRFIPGTCLSETEISKRSFSVTILYFYVCWFFRARVYYLVLHQFNKGFNFFQIQQYDLIENIVRPLLVTTLQELTSHQRIVSRLTEYSILGTEMNILLLTGFRFISHIWLNKLQSVLILLRIS